MLNPKFPPHPPRPTSSKSRGGKVCFPSNYLLVVEWPLDYQLYKQNFPYYVLNKFFKIYWVKIIFFMRNEIVYEL